LFGEESTLPAFQQVIQLYPGREAALLAIVRATSKSSASVADALSRMPR